MNSTLNRQAADAQQVSSLTSLLKVLADENRLRIISCLSGGRKCVCQLTAAIDIPQNLMSHHLRVLRESGLVTDEREGRWIYYRLNAGALAGFLKTLEYSCHCADDQTPLICP